MNKWWETDDWHLCHRCGAVAVGRLVYRWSDGERRGPAKCKAHLNEALDVWDHLTVDEMTVLVVTAA